MAKLANSIPARRHGCALALASGENYHAAKSQPGRWNRGWPELDRLQDRPCPSSLLVVLPSERVAKEWSSIRLTSLIDNSPVLAGKVIDARRRDSGNTTYLKRIANGRGVIKIGWSSSAKVLRSTPAEDLLLDEVDAFEGDTQGEGDPVALLERRFTNFQRGKMFLISTPTERASSRIEREFAKGDQRYFFTPCPRCGHFQRLMFTRLRWPKGEPSQVTYDCVACEEAIPEYEKTRMLTAGMWLATASAPDLAEVGFSQKELDSLQPILEEMEQTRRASFHLSALYSPLGWYSWRGLAEDWEAAQKDTGLLKVFIMTVLAESWLDRGEAPDDQRLYERRESYEIGITPRGGLFLTAGADVQADRIEVEIVAWGRGKQSWSVAYEVLNGDTSTPTPWEALRELLARDWPVEDCDSTLPIMAMAIDTGFRPQMAYAFARRHPQPAHGPAGSRVVARRTVIPVKGCADPYRIVARVSNPDAARKRGGLRIVEVGTGCAKQELFDQLRLPAASSAGEIFPAGYCHLPSYERDYFAGLCSESRVVRSNGRSDWVRDPSVRNEPLDCRVYARAAAAVFGIDRFRERDWRTLEQALGRQAAVPAAPLSADGRLAASMPAPIRRPVRARMRIAPPVW